MSVVAVMEKALWEGLTGGIECVGDVLGSLCNSK
jgi:hypothetical protein